MANILEIKNLKKSFKLFKAGEIKVIENLSFDVPEGSIFGFVGVNGAGKTTTMKMALGLLEIDSGEIFIAGEKVRYGQTVKSVGFLPDVPEFYPYMTPMEYLTLCGEIAGMSKSKIIERGNELLKLVGLSKAKRKIGGFSRGMKQRLGIAQALLNEPKLLICDEPTSALDPQGRKEILDILLEIKGQTTVVFSTHILSDVERVCDRVAFLHNGNVALSGELSEVKKQRNDSYCVEFENIVSAEVFGALFAGSQITGSGSSLGCEVIVKDADVASIIRVLAENKMTPIKFETIEPSLEELFLRVIK